MWCSWCERRGILGDGTFVRLGQEDMFAGRRSVRLSFKCGPCIGARSHLLAWGEDIYEGRLERPFR